MSKYAGVYQVYDESGTLQTSGSFQFAAYWRSTSVKISLPSGLSSGSILVENQYGSSANSTFSC